MCYNKYRFQHKPYTIVHGYIGIFDGESPIENH